MILTVDESENLSPEMLGYLIKNLVLERNMGAERIEKTEIAMLSQSPRVPALKIKENYEAKHSQSCQKRHEKIQERLD